MNEALPPSLPSDETIRRLLARRIDVHRLSKGMVVGTLDGDDRRVTAHGHADTTMTRALDCDTLFEIGSITKLFTALVLADMVDHRDVTLNQSVQDLLPSGVRMPSRNGRSITLFDLACHRSGLPRMPANFDAMAYVDTCRAYKAEMLYAFLADYELARTPGDVEVYSNLGYGLLGRALSRLADQSYEDLVRSRLLDHLGMHRTVIAVPPDLEDALATGHDDKLDAVPKWCFNVMEGAGAFRSSAADMMLFADAFRNPSRSPLAAN